MKRRLLLLSPILFAACDLNHSLGTSPLDDAGPGADTYAATPQEVDASTLPATTDPQPPTGAGTDTSTGTGTGASTGTGTGASTGTSTGTGTGTTPAPTSAALPCDVVAKDGSGARCVSAHSTVRVIVSGYSGPLYQLCKGPSSAGPNSCQGETKDILALGGYADVASHDAFCADQVCSITKIYDQSGKGNDLEPAPAGGAKNTPDVPAKASALPVTVGGHSAYGLLIKPGMGYRTGCNGCTIKKGNGMPLGDEPQTVYMVTSKKDLVDGCCFDYGNAETTSFDDGNGTAEALNFSAGVVWGTGYGGKPGPWVLADLENGLYAGWENMQDKNISSNKLLIFDFVTAVLVGDTKEKNNGKGRFALYGADAQGKDPIFGKLTCMYDGIRPEKPGYVPMAKQGSLVLGTAGDNSSGGAGRFYEGAIIAGPALSGATLAALHDGIVNAGYGATNPTTFTAQSWTGYIENYQFGSGSDRIKLVLTANATGQVGGTVTFGNGMAPPPATDPEAAYPPGMNTTTTMPKDYLEGPAYTIKSGSLEANRLRFTIDPIELWAGWCALQPAPTDGSDICIPNNSYSIEGDATHTTCVLHPTANESVPINCVKWDLCMMSRVCACSPIGCVANYEESGYKTSFDVFLANGTGSGSMTGVFGDHNVHLNRD